MSKPSARHMLTAWSFSRLSDYELCPAKARYKHILRIPEPSNSAMERGSAIHKLAERYIKGEGRALPIELGQFAALFKQLRAQYKKKLPMAMMVEDSWAFTRAWAQTRYDDWTNCWLRIKVDCARYLSVSELRIYDWKTGRMRPEKQVEYEQQLELYATGALTLFPHVKIVHPTLVYLDHGLQYPEPERTILRKQLPALQKKWESRTLKMFADTVFTPTPSASCRFCHYRNDNGGPCQY